MTKETQTGTSSLSQVPQGLSFSPGGRPREFLQISALQLSWCTWDARTSYSKSCSIHHSPDQTVPPPPGSSPALCHTLPSTLGSKLFHAIVHLISSELESSVDCLVSTLEADNHHQSSQHLMGVPRSGPNLCVHG